MSDTQRTSHLVDCLIIPREGDNIETMFRGNAPHLTGYAIVPKEKYERLRAIALKCADEIEHMDSLSPMPKRIRAEIGG